MKIKCKYCGAENVNVDATSFCVNCDKLLSVPTPSITDTSDYAKLPPINQNARFYAKRGFDLKAGRDVLPTKQVQTASAAAPMLHQSRPGITPITKPQSAQPAPSDPPVRPPPSPPISAATPETRSLQRGFPAGARNALIRSISVVSIVTALGIAWWAQTQTVPQPKLIAASSLPSANTNIAPTAFAQTTSGNGTQTAHVSDASEENVPPPVLASAPATSAITKTLREAAPPSTTTENGAMTDPDQEKDQRAATSTRKFAKKRTFRTKRQTPELVQKDRGEEIDRLKTQAFSETKKDRVEGVTVPANPAEEPQQFSPQSTKQKSLRRKGATRVTVREAYGQCQRLANLFRREQCKWHACNGKWGQPGCPSYDRTESALF